MTAQARDRRSWTTRSLRSLRWHVCVAPRVFRKKSDSDRCTSVDPSGAATPAPLKSVRAIAGRASLPTPDRANQLACGPRRAILRSRCQTRYPEASIVQWQKARREMTSTPSSARSERNNEGRLWAPRNERDLDFATARPRGRSLGVALADASSLSYPPSSLAFQKRSRALIRGLWLPPAGVRDARLRCCW
ncbi:uncharacterized protein PV09_08082 [Verruconis gallopava]|uniref:Uncharacterized protein n=1 Tax=Verruconis gallopava TaxID=253628 RepID=A0A0D1XDT1_9PEZI|nr:uncharacterized protein PV09_08082 [Verruconis gallopava]KIW00371.1 hypothetical protein PV09_08082 [Verruconis gallopava]